MGRLPEAQGATALWSLTHCHWVSGVRPASANSSVCSRGDRPTGGGAQRGLGFWKENSEVELRMGKQGAEPGAQAQPGLPCGTRCPPEAISSTCKVGNRDMGMHIYYSTGGISARDLGKSAVTVTFYHMWQL